MLNCGYYITETFRCLAHASGEIRESLGWLEKSPWSGIKPRKLYAILPDQLIRERDGLCAVVLVTCAPIIMPCKKAIYANDWINVEGRPEKSNF